MKKRNKILPILGVIALMLGFMSSTRAVYADPQTDVIVLSGATCSFQSWQYNWTPFLPIAYSDGGSQYYNTVPNLGYQDVTVTITDKVTFNTSEWLSPDYLLSGYVSLRDSFQFDFVGNSSSPQNFQITEVEILDYEINSQYFNIIENISDHYQQVNTNNNRTGKSLIYNRFVYVDFANIAYYGNTMNIISTLKLRVYGATYNTTPSQWSYESSMIQHVFNHTVSGTPVANLRGIKSELRYLDDIYNQNSSNNSQILDVLQNDNSTASSNLASEVGSYDTVESLASTSMAGALPSADTQLSQITQYDYGSLYTDNVSAFAFWKSLGDFVLSNSNLVGIGALLILCLFLGLVVYLLRL